MNGTTTSRKPPRGQRGARRHAPKARMPEELHQPAGAPDSETRGRIAAAATRLFAARGFDGVSIEEICSAANANSAAVHYHFGSKEGLFRYIVQQFAAEKWASARKTLRPPSTRDELKVRLEIFMRQLIEAVVSQPDIFTIVQRWTETIKLVDKNFIRDGMAGNFATVVDFFRRSKKSGLVADDIDPFYAAVTIASIIGHTIRNAQMLKDFLGYSLEDEKTREQWIEQTVRIFLNGILEKGDR